jgi:beta-catenin-like protein 1
MLENCAHVQQLENSFLELLVENLNRLNEEEEADRLGVFHVLGILENVLAFNPAISKVLIKKTKTLSWTLNRIQKPAQDDNRGYAAELLSILIQSDRENRLAYGKEDGVEVSLRVLSVSYLGRFFVAGFLNDCLAI